MTLVLIPSTSIVRAPQGIDSAGDDLDHTCARHPYEDQPCVGDDCVALCGAQLDPCETVYVGPSTPDCCVVCDWLFEILDRLNDDDA